MLSCFAGCSGQKTLTGQITALEGQSVTVQLGTLAQDAGNGQGGQQGTPPDKPEGEQANAEGGQGMQTFTAGEESMTVSVNEDNGKNPFRRRCGSNYAQ